MANTDTHSILGLLQNEHVSLVISDQEMQMTIDGLFAAQNGSQFFNGILLSFLFGR